MKKLTLSALLTTGLLVTACGSEEHTSENTLVEGNPEITLATGPWESETASTNVISTVLEDAGYDVEIVTLDAAVTWESLVTGDADAQVGAWLPYTSAPFAEEYADDLDFLGVNLEGAKLGLVVPTYMDVDSVADLTDQADQTITGIEPGSSVVGATEEALDVYDNLEDWEVVTSSAGAMTAELRSAYENEEEIVVTGWTPHWKFQEFDLKFLEDPEGVFGEEENIETVTRLDFAEDEPIAHSILDNFYWTVEDMGSVMLAIQNGQDAEEAAREWVDENQEKVDEWTTEAREMAGESSEG